MIIAIQTKTAMIKAKKTVIIFNTSKQLFCSHTKIILHRFLCLLQ